MHMRTNTMHRGFHHTPCWRQGVSKYEAPTATYRTHMLPFMHRMGNSSALSPCLCPCIGAGLPVICSPTTQHPAPKQLHHEATQCMNVFSTPPCPLHLPLLTATAFLLHLMHKLLPGIKLQGGLGCGLAAATCMAVCRRCWRRALDLIRSVAVQVRLTKSSGC